MASPDRFDGLEVDRHQARFGGTVELDPTDADRMSVDTQFMAVVVCTVGGAAVDGNAKGELVRTNKFKLQHFAVVRDGELQNELYEKLGALSGLPDDPPEMFTPDGGIAEAAVEVPEPELVILDDVEQEEVFSPGRSTSPPAREPVSAGVPASGATPRQYDADLAGFLNE